MLTVEIQIKLNSGSERTPVVLPEVEQLLPPLSVEQFSVADLLEAKQWALDT